MRLKKYLPQALRNRYRNDVLLYCDIAEKFPAKRRLLFFMYFRYGHSMKEISELLGISESSVSRRLATIIRQIEREVFGPSWNQKREIS